MLPRDDNAGADENIVSHVYRDAVFVSSNNRLGLYLRVAEWTLHGITPCVNSINKLMLQIAPLRSGQVAGSIATKVQDLGSTTESLLGRASATSFSPFQFSIWQ